MRLYSLVLRKGKKERENMENQIKLKKAPAYRFIPYLLVVLAYCQIYVGTSLVQQAGVQLKEWFSIGDTGLSYLQTVCYGWYGNL